MRQFIDRFDAKFGRRFVELFNTARWLRDLGYHEPAIITAHMACELRTESVLTDTFDCRGIGYLTDPVRDLLPNYNLGNPNVRKVYEAVTGDVIHDAPFWSRFQQHNKRRNG